MENEWKYWIFRSIVFIFIEMGWEVGIEREVFGLWDMGRWFIGYCIFNNKIKRENLKE